jgi:hypothetical protein
VVNHLGGWRSRVEQQVKIGKEESYLALPITLDPMACSTMVVLLTISRRLQVRVLPGQLGAEFLTPKPKSLLCSGDIQIKHQAKSKPAWPGG